MGSSEISSPGTPGFLLNSPPFDQVVANMVTESGRGGDGNRAAGRDFDGRIDEVFFPIAFAGGNVAGQSVAGQGRDGDVANAPDAAFEHATAPDRNVARQAERLDLASAGVAADAAELDVNDARGAEVESSLGITRVANGLVEANRSLQLLLEPGVIENVVPPKRLLHHQQIEFVKALQVLDIGQRVSRVCVNGQENIGMRVADGAHEIEILAGLDLQFDALVAGVELGGNFFQEGFGRSLQSQRNTALAL